MPSAKASANVDLRGWQQVPASPKDTSSLPSPPNGENVPTRDPLMHASMPLMASTNDALSQYYTNANQPQQRILPARPGGAVT